MQKVARGTIAGLLVAVVVSAVSVLAQSSASPLIGTWKFNAQKSKLTNTLAPKDLMRKYEDRGEGVYIFTQEGHGPDGTKMFSMYVAKEDGREYPLVIQGADDFGAISLKRVDGYTSEQTEKAVQGGRVTATGTRKISPDGKTMTITIRARALQGGQDDGAVAVPAAAGGGRVQTGDGRTNAFAPPAEIQRDVDVFVFEKQ
jgi:hypothetical protein